MLFNLIEKTEKRSDAFLNATGYKTLKAAKADPRFVKSLMAHGNAKLKDFCPDVHGASENIAMQGVGVNFRYAQFNLLAKTTCPYATTGCKKFCYAKRDERYPNVVENRRSSFNASRDPQFVENMIFTINCLLYSRRYYGNVMILRIHESGDFYNQAYLNSWLEIIKYFAGRENIIFQFYTKCFDYILSLDAEHGATLAAALDNHNIGLSLSIDDTSDPMQVLKAMTIQKKYNNVNIYRVVNNADGVKADHVCDCAHCAKCGHCTLTTGENTIVVCH